jgi:hypothetical protein
MGEIMGMINNGLEALGDGLSARRDEAVGKGEIMHSAVYGALNTADLGALVFTDGATILVDTAGNDSDCVGKCIDVGDAGFRMIAGYGIGILGPPVSAIYNASKAGLNLAGRFYRRIF